MFCLVQIFDALTKTAQLENTYILWAADHGDGQSDHFHWRKGFPYEFASHVPWMLRWPKNAAALGEPRAASWKRGGIIERKAPEYKAPWALAKLLPRRTRPAMCNVHLRNTSYYVRMKLNIYS